MTDLPSETFCALPWMHLSTRPDGAMRVCCTANASSVGKTDFKIHGGKLGELRTEDGKPANLNVVGLNESWNNSYMKNVRKQMLAGEKPASCMKCFKEEDAGHNSKRMWETAYWLERFDLDDIIGETKEDGEIPPKIRYIDLRLGSKCNLKCIMCSPHDSSAWIPDWKEYYPQVKSESLKYTSQWHGGGADQHGATYNWYKNNPKFWDDLYSQIPNIYQLYFAGGESTIIEEHYTLLEKVIEMGYAEQIELRYNSNGVEMPDRLFELWRKFRRIRFHYSIDSIGVMNDYIRYPSKWNHQVRQMHLLDNTDDNVEVTLACAVQALNIYYIPDFIKWKLNEGFKKINMWPFGAGGVNYHFVYHPPQLNVKILPKWFKDDCHLKYVDFYSWWEKNWQKGIPSWHKDEVTLEEWKNANYGIKRLKGLISFMKSEDWSNRMIEFKEYITIMDKVRKTSFANTFPEMKDLLNE